MTAPRVMMTTDAVGGVWVFSTTIAAALAAHGAEVLIAVLGPPASQRKLVALDRMNAREAGTGDGRVQLIETGLALEWLDPAGLNCNIAHNTLATIAADFAPDIVHLNGYREAAYDWTVPVVVTAHSCVSSWWEACRGGRPNGPEWDAYAANLRAGLAAASVWTAPTAAMAEAVVRLHRPRRPGLVIANGASGDLCGTLDRQAQRESFILAVGRIWDEAKGIATLVEAASEVPWPVRLIGPCDGPHQLDVASPLDAHSAAQVEKLGELAHADVLDAGRRCGIFVAPARYEPFGLGVLEAARSGAPLVLSDIPSFRENWSGAARLVPPGDPAALAHAVSRLVADPAERDRLGALAFERAKRFDLKRTAERYLDLYRALIGRKMAWAARTSAALARGAA